MVPKAGLTRSSAAALMEDTRMLATRAHDHRLGRAAVWSGLATKMANCDRTGLLRKNSRCSIGATGDSIQKMSPRVRDDNWSRRCLATPFREPIDLLVFFGQMCLLVESGGVWSASAPCASPWFGEINSVHLQRLTARWCSGSSSSRTQRLMLPRDERSWVPPVRWEKWHTHTMPSALTAVRLLLKSAGNQTDHRHKLELCRGVRSNAVPMQCTRLVRQRAALCTRTLPSHPCSERMLRECVSNACQWCAGCQSRESPPDSLLSLRLFRMREKNVFVSWNGKLID